MTLGRYARTELRCSVPVLLLIPAAAFFGRIGEISAMLLSLSVHELAHAFMAHRLGYAITAIEVQPFGFIARLSREIDSPSEAAAIAASGPVVSLLLSLCSAGFTVFLPFSAGNSAFLLTLSFFNLTLGAVNLLPVLPLDGGRIALAFARNGGSSKQIRSRGKLLCSLGAVSGAVAATFGGFAAVFGFLPLPQAVSFIITGLFITAAAVTESKKFSVHALSSLISSASRLTSGGALRVFAVALCAENTVSDALRALSAHGYGLILVTDASMRTIGILDESRLLSAAMRGETSRSLGSLLAGEKVERFLHQ